MKYLDVTTTIEFVNIRLWTWKEGTQSIYEAVNKKLSPSGHPQYRSHEGRTARRWQSQSHPQRYKEGEKVEEFDKLIVTTPLDQLR
jgi:hypothetical protein